MNNLVKIASDIKEVVEEPIFLKGTIGRARYGPVFIAPLYEVTVDSEGKTIIHFNESFKEWNLNKKPRKEYTAINEFCKENNYELVLKKYDMTPPTPPPGVMF